MLAAASRLDETRARRGETRAGLFPQVRLSASAGGTSNVANLVAPAPATDADPGDFLGPFRGFGSGRLSAAQTLWDWGRLGAGIRVADLEELVAFEELRAARQSAALLVRTAYLALASARAGRRLKDEAADLARKHLETERQRQNRDVATELEVLRAEARALTREQDAWRAERDERKAEADLALALGLEPTAPLELAPYDPGGEPLPEPDAALASARVARPDVRIAEAQLAQEQLRLESESRTQWPLFSLAGSLGAVTSTSTRSAGPDRTETLLATPSPDVTVMLSVSWNVFDGFRAANAYRRAEGAVSRQRQSRERLARTVVAEVETERNAVLDAAGRLRLAERERDVARRALAIARSKLQKGTVTALDEHEARLAENEAEQRLVQATYDRAIATMRLARALGEDPPERKLEGAPEGWKSP